MGCEGRVGYEKGGEGRGGEQRGGEVLHWKRAYGREGEGRIE